MHRDIAVRLHDTTSNYGLVDVKAVLNSVCKGVTHAHGSDLSAKVKAMRTHELQARDEDLTCVVLLIELLSVTPRGESTLTDQVSVIADESDCLKRVAEGPVCI